MNETHLIESIGLEDLVAARNCLAGIAARTPLLQYSGGGDDRDIYLKPECLQPHGSFKIRGSCNAVLSLSAAERDAGIYTMSAGNFGQGIAAIARQLGVPVRVYAPDTAARNKIDRMRSLGACVELMPFPRWWDLLSGEVPPGEAGSRIHPCSGRAVIIGNATIAAEILEDAPDIDAIFVPFGGGGLTLGVLAATRLLAPHVAVIACEASGSTPLTSAMRAGGPVDVLRDPTSFIDGIGGTRVLTALWPMLRRFVSGTEVVDESLAAETVVALHRYNHLVVEGAGAVPVAAARMASQWKGKKVVAIVSGGNIDTDVLMKLLRGTV